MDKTPSCFLFESAFPPRNTYQRTIGTPTTGTGAAAFSTGVTAEEFDCRNPSRPNATDVAYVRRVQTHQRRRPSDRRGLARLRADGRAAVTLTLGGDGEDLNALKAKGSQNLGPERKRLRFIGHGQSALSAFSKGKTSRWFSLARETRLPYGRDRSCRGPGFR